MQLLVPAVAHNPAGHTASSIRDALVGRSGSRLFTFRYELLTSDNVFVADLTDVLSATVTQNWLADIKRTAKFTVRDTGEINYLSDRIKPWVRMHLPPYGADDWVEWPLGVFLLSTPARSADSSDVVLREVEAYDQLQVYADDLVTTRYTVLAGEVYTTAVSTLLGSITTNITASASAVPADKEWSPGTSKLKIINELLGAINYESLSFDEAGVAIVRPYTTPSDRSVEWTYADDFESIMLPDVEQTLDLFSVPNRWVLVVSDPDRSALTSTVTNDNPSSPTSTVSRQRTIVDFRTEQDAADQAALDARAERLAFESSQVFEAIDWSSGLNPLHSGNDAYRITYGPLAIDAIYTEQSWEMQLHAGSTMVHRARRVVTV